MVFLRRNKRQGLKKKGRRPFRASSLGRATRAGFKRMVAANRKFSAPTRSLTPFPESKWVMHKYATRLILPAGTIGSTQGYVFRANGLYDPDYTGAGHQPMYRDELALQYDKYTVVSSWIKITFIPDISNAVPFIANLALDDASAWETNHATVLETRRNNRVINPVALTKPLVMRGRFDHAKLIKTTRQALLADDLVKTPSGQDPSAKALWYYNLGIHPIDVTVALSALQLVVEMGFVALWRDKKVPTQS